MRCTEWTTVVPGSVQAAARRVLSRAANRIVAHQIAAHTDLACWCKMAMACEGSVQSALIGYAAFPRTPETIDAADRVIFEKSQNRVHFYPSIGAAICWRIRDSVRGPLACTKFPKEGKRCGILFRV